jgi:hypothetical protein
MHTTLALANIIIISVISIIVLVLVNSVDKVLPKVGG